VGFSRCLGTPFAGQPPDLTGSFCGAVILIAAVCAAVVAARKRGAQLLPDMP
jgi:hypothetical protein